jgi:MFS family permease
MSTPLGSVPARWVALAVGMLAVVLNVLDFSVVGIAATEIRRDLRLSDATMMLVLGAYAMAFVLVLLATGRLGDSHGRRRVFIVGGIGFAAASLLAAAAWGPVPLVVARVVQGACAGAMVPQVLATIAVAFDRPGPERIAAFSPYGVVVPLTAPLAPLLGRYLVDTDPTGLGWRSVFVFNAAIAVVAVLATVAFVPDLQGESPERRRVPGAALAAGLAALMLIGALTGGRAAGWPPWVAGPVLVAVLVLAAVVLAARRARRTGRPPAVAVHLFTERRYAIGMLAILVLAAAILGFFPFFVTYLQAALGYSAVHASAVALPWAAGVVAGSVLACVTVPRWGRVVPVGGAVVAIAGILLLGAAFSTGSAQDGRLVLPMLLSGFGKGLIAPALIDVTLSRVPDRDAGSAAGTLLTIQQVGGAVGLAVVGTAVAAVLATGVHDTRAEEAQRLGTEAFVNCVREQVGTVTVDPPPRCAAVSAAVDDGAIGPADADAVDRAVADEVRAAQRATAGAALTRGVRFEAGFVAACLVLLLLLPADAFRRQRDDQPYPPTNWHTAGGNSNASHADDLPRARAPVSSRPTGLGTTQRRP